MKSQTFQVGGSCHEFAAHMPSYGCDDPVPLRLHQERSGVIEESEPGEKQDVRNVPPMQCWRSGCRPRSSNQFGTSLNWNAFRIPNDPYGRNSGKRYENVVRLAEKPFLNLSRIADVRNGGDAGSAAVILGENNHRRQIPESRQIIETWVDRSEKTRQLPRPLSY